jgi:hypothetical protein
MKVQLGFILQVSETIKRENKKGRDLKSLPEFFTNMQLGLQRLI